MFKKFKGHYSKRKTHKTDRDVMSYEDMPLDDYEQEKTEMSPQAVKKIVLGACIAIAAGLIVFAFANRDKLTWENISNWWTYDVLGNAGHGYPVDIIGSEVSSGNFAVSQVRDPGGCRDDREKLRREFLMAGWRWERLHGSRKTFLGGKHEREKD